MELFKLISIWGAVAIIWLLALLAGICFFAMVISSRNEEESSYDKEQRLKKESKAFLKELTNVKEKTLEEIEAAISYLDEEKLSHERYIRKLRQKRERLEEYLDVDKMLASDKSYDDDYFFSRPEKQLDNDLPLINDDTLIKMKRE